MPLLCRYPFLSVLRKLIDDTPNLERNDHWSEGLMLTGDHCDQKLLNIESFVRTSISTAGKKTT
jgi:hypothetical protein